MQYPFLLHALLFDFLLQITKQFTVKEFLNGDAQAIAQFFDGGDGGAARPPLVCGRSVPPRAEEPTQPGPSPVPGLCGGGQGVPEVKDTQKRMQLWKLHPLFRLISQVWDLRPWQGTRSAGPDFSAMRNRGKNRQRRGLPPPCGIHPAGTGWSVRRSIFSPWPGEVTWMAWRSMGGIYFSAGASIYRKGFTLVSRCSQLPDAWFPAAGTPLLQGRPGHGNHLAIGPAAQDSLVWWHKQGPQQG